QRRRGTYRGYAPALLAQTLQRCTARPDRAAYANVLRHRTASGKFRLSGGIGATHTAHRYSQDHSACRGLIILVDVRDAAVLQQLHFVALAVVADIHLVLDPPVVTIAFRAQQFGTRESLLDGSTHSLRQFFDADVVVRSGWQHPQAA